jgi:CRISPR system Cascade subunit CasD
MADYLVFTLSATLGAMGELAGHERRGSLGWPGRAAILGLAGAALGIRRDGDFSALDALKTAVAVFDEGRVLRDYHTVETVPRAQAKAPQTRAAALRAAAGQGNTTITLRDYRQDPLFGVALWGGALDALEQALKAPQFQLYLGRKSCPLSAPPAPRIVAAKTPAAALNHLQLPPWRRGAIARRMAADICLETEGPGARIETRQDAAIDRQHWHFAPREVRIMPVEIAPQAQEGQA